MRILAVFCLTSTVLSPIFVAAAGVKGQGENRVISARGRREPSEKKKRRLNGKGGGGFQEADSSDIEFENKYSCKFCGEGNDSKLTDGTISAACFSGNMKVQVEGLVDPVAMKDLQVGNRIMIEAGHAENPVYEPVYAFGHHNPTRKATFLQFHTASKQMPLEMTGEHLVFLQGKTNPVRAASVKVGDVLQSSNGDGEAAIVQMIERVERRSLYAPLTTSGSIVVNGIKASSYINILQQSTATSTSNDDSIVLRGGKDDIPIVSHQRYVHLVLAPYRLVCRTTGSILCQTSNNNKDGMPHYISFGIWLNQWASQQHTVVHALFLFSVTLMASLVFLLETAMFGSTAVMSVAALAAAVWVALKKAPIVVIARKTKSA